MKGLISEENLTSIGNAIRNKTGKPGKIKVSKMAEEIQNIQTRPSFIIKKLDGTTKPVWKIISSSTPPNKADVWAKGE